jgi:hypothetical protein
MQVNLYYFLAQDNYSEKEAKKSLLEGNFCWAFQLPNFIHIKSCDHLIELQQDDLRISGAFSFVMP